MGLWASLPYSTLVSKVNHSPLRMRRPARAYTHAPGSFREPILQKQCSTSHSLFWLLEGVDRRPLLVVWGYGQLFSQSHPCSRLSQRQPARQATQREQLQKSHMGGLSVDSNTQTADRLVTDCKTESQKKDHCSWIRVGGTQTFSATFRLTRNVPAERPTKNPNMKVKIQLGDRTYRSHQYHDNFNAGVWKVWTTNNTSKCKHVRRTFVWE